MKIEFTDRDGRTETCALPYESCAHVEGKTSCTCGSKLLYSPEAIQGYDTVEGRAFCRGCGATRGRLLVTLSTIFGLAEDERVTAGPWKVY